MSKEIKKKKENRRRRNTFSSITLNTLTQHTTIQQAIPFVMNFQLLLLLFLLSYVLPP